MVEVIAHRGASEVLPEHTLAAYRAAIEAGADALEADVRLTADGHLVCVHDRTVDRTSNGSGVLSTLELAELAELDFGSWSGANGEPEAPDLTDADRRHVLTLEQLLELVADSPRPVGLAVETKHPTRYAGLVERRLAALLDHFAMLTPRPDEPARVRMMSFSALAVLRMSWLAPRLPTVFLMEQVPLPFRSGALPPGATQAGPSIDVLRRHPGYVDRVHSRGGRVSVWTVDDPDDVRLCLDLGVDAIITNRPGPVLALLGR